jgi:hypothetical protein
MSVLDVVANRYTSSFQKPRSGYLEGLDLQGTLSLPAAISGQREELVMSDLRQRRATN